jgi:PAS domain S-box-containing protein
MSFLLIIPPEVARLFASLELSPDPVFGTNRLNKIVFWNRSAERLLGFSAAEAVGAPCGSLLSGCDVHGNRYCGESCPVTQMAVQGEAVRRFVLQLRTKDGRGVAAEVSILHLEAPPPDLFFLAHLLQVQDAQPLFAGHAETGDAPPRPALDAARESPDARARKLTSREVEILGMLAAGHTTPDMAARLHISRLTARNHLQNILDKLEVHSKSEAVAFAFQKHLV